jgi:D-alanine-D-alanine ligase
MVRLDCRIDANGDVFVIEVNPNPSLARGDDFAQSAREAGIEYESLVQKIIDNALREKT